MSISGISQLLLTQFGPNFKGKVKARTRQFKDKVRARSWQGQGEVQARSRRSSGKVKARSRRGQGKVERQGQGKINVKLKQNNHNKDNNYN